MERPEARAVQLLREAAARAREEGRSVLQEPDVFPALEALGIGVPRWFLVPGLDATTVLAHGIGVGSPVEVSGTPGDRVVVKLLSPQVPHRTEVGGVRVAPRTPEGIADAIAALAAASPDPAARFLVMDFVEHSAEPGGELLLGARWTDDFGPVVTLGLGGVASELLAEGTGMVRLFAAAQVDRASLAGSLAGTSLAALATGDLRRRTPRVPLDGLARALASFAALAREVIPGALQELEVNPLATVDGRVVALDALARVTPAGAAGEASPPPLSEVRKEGIRRILAPASVAVVGVSSRMNPGRVIVRNLLHAGFPSEHLRIVKPGEESLDGCRCVPDVDALDPPVDLLVVAVGAEEVPGLLETVVRGRRARSVVLIPGGLGEGATGDRGVAVRDALAGAGGQVVVNGGNCLGVRSVPGRCDTLFIPQAKLGFPQVPPHPVALVTQSGAFAIARTSAQGWLNPRVLVTVGNQLDLTIGEYVEALADDPEIRVVACYVEGFRPLDGARVARAARTLKEEGRLLLLIRGGRTHQGAQAAVSHTASVAGDYAVTRALVEEAGGMVAESLDAFDHLLMVGSLLANRRVDGTGLGAVSNAGFECVTMADAAGRLHLGALTPETRSALDDLLERHRLRGIVSPTNPLDLTPILGDQAFPSAASLVLADPSVDVGVVGCVPLTPALQTLEAGNPLSEDVHAAGGVLEGLQGLWMGTEKAWVAVVDGGARYDAFATALLQGGIPTFRRADAAVATLSRYVGWRLGATR